MENRTENTQEQQVGQEKEFKEINLKFGKGCVGESFTGKDDKEYIQILIPNSDPEDHRPWATFVARANAVHEDKFGKGMWLKLPSEGHTTVRRNVRVGEDAEGHGIFEHQDTKVSNQELKGMVEFYKNRPNDRQKPDAERTSVRQRMAEKQAEVKQAASERTAVTQTRATEAAI